MSRRFYIENQDGERLDLNGAEGVWLYEVKGLGIETSESFADLDRGFFALTENGIPQQTITGTLLFKGPARLQIYREYVDFIMQASELRFVFVPLDTEYYRQVRLKFLSRGESTRVHLETSLSLAVLGPWYLPTPISVTLDSPRSANNFRWNVSRWGNAPLAASTSGTYSTRVTVDGHIPAAVKITFTGTVEQPTFTLRGILSDTIYGQCKLSGSYSGKVVLCTEYGNSYIKANSTDLLDDIDLSYEPFFRIPVNEECMIEIGSPDFTGTAEVEIYEYFRSV